MSLTLAHRIVSGVGCFDRQVAPLDEHRFLPVAEDQLASSAARAGSKLGGRAVSVTEDFGFRPSREDTISNQERGSGGSLHGTQRPLGAVVHSPAELACALKGVSISDQFLKDLQVAQRGGLRPVSRDQGTDARGVQDASRLPCGTRALQDPLVHGESDLLSHTVTDEALGSGTHAQESTARLDVGLRRVGRSDQGTEAEVRGSVRCVLSNGIDRRARCLARDLDRGTSRLQFLNAKLHRNHAGTKQGDDLLVEDLCRHEEATSGIGRGAHVADLFAHGPLHRGLLLEGVGSFAQRTEHASQAVLFAVLGAGCSGEVVSRFLGSVETGL